MIYILLKSLDFIELSLFCKGVSHRLLNFENAFLDP
jgi:hypothetical protein